MLRWKHCLPLAPVALLAFQPHELQAARVQFHYLPVDPQGHSVLLPSRTAAAGERVSWFGTVRESYFGRTTVNPTARPLIVNVEAPFRHPYTGRTVIVPLSLPEGTPRIEHVRNRVVYNYGSYTVEVRFLPDGSFDVIYDSGLLRGL